MFTVSLRVLSSLYTQDDRVNAFQYYYSIGQDSPELISVCSTFLGPLLTDQ